MVAQLTEYSKLLHHSSPSKLCEWRYMTCTIPRKRAPEEADMPTSSYWPLPRSELYRWPGGGGGGGGAPKTQKRKNPKNAADTMSEATAIGISMDAAQLGCVPGLGNVPARGSNPGLCSHFFVSPAFFCMHARTRATQPHTGTGAPVMPATPSSSRTQ